MYDTYWYDMYVYNILMIIELQTSYRNILAQDAQKNSQLLFMAKMRLLQLILKQR
jgi:hypothetical protein